MNKYKNGLSANTFMGQHFLTSPAVLGDIVKAADIKKTDTVLEIGPGKGVLTRALRERAKKVIAVEKDARLALYLRDVFVGQKNVSITTGDILKKTARELGLGNQKYKLVANIPYYITSRLLRRFLENRPRPSSITILVQHEVAERIVAIPPYMNLLALSVQCYGKARIIRKVPRSFFNPRPNVDSALIVIENISDIFFTKNNIRAADFFAIAKKAFSQKRKMLRGSLGINSTKRPQELEREEWMAIVKGKN